METESIETYRDYTYIMYIICDKTASYYSKIKNTINIPIVLCSTGLSMMNTYTSDNTTTNINIKNIGIGLNLLIALSIAILNMYKITEKEFFFTTYSTSFFKIYNKINIELAKKKSVLANVDIIHIITEYNLLCENIHFHIPSRIREKIKKNYKTYKLPFLVSNTQKNKNTIWKYFMSSDKSDDTEENGYISHSYSYHISDSSDSTPTKNNSDNNFNNVVNSSPIFSIVQSNKFKESSTQLDVVIDVIETKDNDLLDIQNKKINKTKFKTISEPNLRPRSSSPIQKMKNEKIQRRRSHSPVKLNHNDIYVRKSMSPKRNRIPLTTSSEYSDF